MAKKVAARAKSETVKAKKMDDVALVPAASEPSHEEIAHLRSLGLEVRTGVAKTGVVATLRGGEDWSLAEARTGACHLGGAAAHFSAPMASIWS